MVEYICYPNEDQLSAVGCLNVLSSIFKICDAQFR